VKTMNHLLTSREKKALHKFYMYDGDWEPSGKFIGMGNITLAKLLELGLVDEKPSHVHGKVYKMNPQGYECIHGVTLETIMAGEPGQYPELKIWKWPPEEI